LPITFAKKTFIVSKITPNMSPNQLKQKNTILVCPSMYREMIATTKSPKPKVRTLEIKIQHPKDTHAL
jgi:hypothetical protein